MIAVAGVALILIGVGLLPAAPGAIVAGSALVAAEILPHVRRG